jgi:hypothetical protein
MESVVDIRLASTSLLRIPQCIANQSDSIVPESNLLEDQLVEEVLCPSGPVDLQAQQA